MKFILFLLLLTTSIFSSNLSTLYKFYEKQKYDKACDYAFKYYYKKQNKRSEKYLTLYGLSCLETNNLARVATPMMGLTQSKDARANASYFGAILLQKQLLMQALIDERPLGYLELPRTPFVLSTIFSLFIKQKYTKEKNIYHFIDMQDENITYRLYTKKYKKERYYMILDIYKSGKFTKRYQYK